MTFEELEEFENRVQALEGTLTTGSTLTAQFNAELARATENIQGTTREVRQLSTGISRGVRGALDGIVMGGESLSEALNGIATSIINTAYKIATQPVVDALGGALAGGINSLFGGLFQFADGGAFTQGRVVPFANGGIVSSPTTFPMRGATGLMGEAGPEAIMPLARGADGKLGVRADGGTRTIQVVMNISTPDVAGFQRSQGQIAAEISRAVSRGARNR